LRLPSAPSGFSRCSSITCPFYYLGGSVGITVSGYGYQAFGWAGVTGIGLLLLTNILAIGLLEMKRKNLPPAS